MREIKFRGKCTPEFPHPTVKWVYGSLVSDSKKKKKTALICVHLPVPTRDGNSFWYEVDADTVGQFTGIKDISGAEIYEGDIVTFKDDETDENVRGLVTYSVEGTWLVVCDGFCEPLCNVRKTTLILNNVHDVPELLGADDARD